MWQFLQRTRPSSSDLTSDEEMLPSDALHGTNNKKNTKKVLLYNASYFSYYLLFIMHLIVVAIIHRSSTTLLEYIMYALRAPNY
ncbi:putative phosphatidylinositol kinase L615 [Trichinella spiralis]|uniref:putative phosphatidylinositol kinase L615 n=1 Tax=Trichinella spiralis TaxID=6334 RepID=UPI0001EFC43B|nr:putative phosphatidylinositol kinase L615 [Trichinella spiralis]